MVFGKNKEKTKRNIILAERDHFIVLISFHGAKEDNRVEVYDKINELILQGWELIGTNLENMGGAYSTGNNPWLMKTSYFPTKP